MRANVAISCIIFASRMLLLRKDHLGSRLNLLAHLHSHRVTLLGLLHTFVLNLETLHRLGEFRISALKGDGVTGTKLARELNNGYTELVVVVHDLADSFFLGGCRHGNQERYASWKVVSSW